jgi:protein-disulfide isomerase
MGLYFCKKLSLLVSLCLVLSGVNSAMASSAQNTPDAARQAILAIKSHDFSLGQVKAPVAIVEYASLTCHHCASFHEHIFPKLQQEYIDKGLVHFAFRHFPLDIVASKAAQITLCAPKEKRFALIGVLFKQQESWGFVKNYLEILTNIAKLSGFSGQDLDACLADATKEKHIFDGMNEARALEIKGTPSIFIQGKRYEGEHQWEAFRAAIERELGANKSAQ